MGRIPYAPHICKNRAYQSLSVCMMGFCCLNSETNKQTNKKLRCGNRKRAARSYDQTHHWVDPKTMDSTSPTKGNTQAYSQKPGYLHDAYRDTCCLAAPHLSPLSSLSLPLIHHLSSCIDQADSTMFALLANHAFNLLFTMLDTYNMNDHASSCMMTHAET